MYNIEEGRFESTKRKKRFFLFVVAVVVFSILLIIYVNQYNRVVKINYKKISVKEEINNEELEKQRLSKLIEAEISKVVEDEMSEYRMPDVNNIIWIEEPVWLRFIR